jgi:ribosome maturation factor RimP
VLALSSGTDRIRALAEPVAAELGLEVLDIELHGSAPRQVLRIYLDSPSQGSVTVADCEAVSRRLGDVLDAHDALSGRYMLEVSSPGVKRNIVGRLMSFDGQTLGIETDDGRRCDVAFEEMEKANFEHEFPSVTRPGRRRR